jgi:hypothetical protein
VNRDRRTRNPRACRPLQGARRIGGGWAVDDRWAGIATVPRSVAADSLLEFVVLDAVEELAATEHAADSLLEFVVLDPVEELPATERRVSLRRGAVRPVETAPEEESV